MSKINIQINNLVFSYPAPDENIFTLKVDELKIYDADFVSLIGPNGCGKSTLLKIIVNLLKPKKGDIKIFNKLLNKITQKELAKYISYVPQTNYSVFPFSVYEIVMMGRFHKLSMLGFETKEDKEIVKNALNEMQVYHLAKKGIKELSGGEAQRVFIARAIAQQSKIILLDEPTSHLDIEHQIMIFEKLIELNSKDNKTIITVSHDLNLVANYSKRIILLKDGNVKLDGDKKVLLNKDNIRKYFNVDANIINDNTNKFHIVIYPNI